jgi:hypothetical protein
MARTSASGSKTATLPLEKCSHAARVADYVAVLVFQASFIAKGEPAATSDRGPPLGWVGIELRRQCG